MNARELKARRLAGGDLDVLRALLAGEKVRLSSLDPEWVRRYGRKPDYRAYLESAEWQQTRERAFQHYGRLCCLCGSVHDLNVHHRTYLRLGREALADLTVLCRDCHATYHGRFA